MHNTKEQNEAFRKAWDATNAYWKEQQKAYEANPVLYKAQYEEQKKAYESKISKK